MTIKVTHPVGFKSSELEVKVTDGQWKELEKEGGIELSDQYRRRLQEVMAEYRRQSLVYQAWRRPREVRPILRKLTTALGNLEAELRIFLDKYVDRSRLEYSAAFWQIYRVGQKRNSYRGRLALGAFLTEVCAWHDCVTAALDDLPQDSGRPDDPNIGRFLSLAHMIFDAAGGRGIHTDEAVNFLVAACAMVGYRVHSREALVKTLRKSRKELRRKRPS